MKTDLDYKQPDLFGPVVFRPDFNNFERINFTQAWSLFFTASQEDKVLGFNPELGWFFNNILIAVVASGTIWAIFFNSF